MADAEKAQASLLTAGATEREAVHEVGGGIRVASVRLPPAAGVGGTRAVLGIIENPHFAVSASPGGVGGGPGR